MARHQHYKPNKNQILKYLNQGHLNFMTWTILKILLCCKKTPHYRMVKKQRAKIRILQNLWSKMPYRQYYSPSCLGCFSHQLIREQTFDYQLAFLPMDTPDGLYRQLRLFCLTRYLPSLPARELSGNTATKTGYANFPLSYFKSIHNTAFADSSINF